MLGKVQSNFSQQKYTTHLISSQTHQLWLIPTKKVVKAWVKFCGRDYEVNFSLLRSTKKKAKWNEIAKDLYLKSGRCYFRNPKQIRERWLNHLDPQICKSEWSINEDHMIISTVLEKGRKWALIAKMGGSQRT